MAITAVANKAKRKPGRPKKKKSTRKKDGRYKKRATTKKKKSNVVRTSYKKQTTRRRRKRNPPGFDFKTLAIIGGAAGTLAVLGGLISYFRESIWEGFAPHPNKVKVGSIAVLGAAVGMALRKWMKPKNRKYGDMVITATGAVVGYQVINLLYERYAARMVIERIENVATSAFGELTEAEISQQEKYLEALYGAQINESQQVPSQITEGAAMDYVGIDENGNPIFSDGSYQYIANEEGDILFTDNPDLLDDETGIVVAEDETGIVFAEDEYGIVVAEDDYGIVVAEDEYGMYDDYEDDDDPLAAWF